MNNESRFNAFLVSQQGTSAFKLDESAEMRGVDVETSSIPQRHNMPSPRSGVTEDQLLRLALAMAKPGTDAMLLDEQNRRSDYLPIPEAVAGGHTYAVEVDDRILVFDQDDPRLWGKLKALVHELRSRKLSPVVWESGQPGHHHLDVRVEDAACRGEMIALAKNLGLVPRLKQRMRPVLSPHRLGLPVKLVTPQDPELAIDFLSRRGRRGSLPPRIESLLVDGDVLRAYPHKYEDRSDRSAVMFAIILSGIQHNCDREALYRRLRDANNAGGARLQCTIEGVEISEKSARDDFNASWAGALQWIRENPAQGDHARRTVDNAAIKTIEVAARTNIRGRTAATDLNMVLKFVDKAYELSTLRVGFSVRELAEALGISSHKTVKEGLKRIHAAGWIRRLKSGRGDKASLYELQLPYGVVSPGAHSDDLRGARGENGLVTIHFDRSLFRRSWRGRKGLGPYARWVLEALLCAEQPVSRSALAKHPALPCSRPTVYRAVEALRAWGLVIESEQKFLSVADDLIERIRDAERGLRLDTAAVEQHAKHGEQRDKYAAKRAKREQERAKRDPDAQRRSNSPGAESH